MIEGSTASEAEMIIAFLRAEVASPRFSGHIAPCFEGASLSQTELITQGDVGNEYQNDLRRRILRAYRGYGRDDLLFRWFPTDVVWRRVQIELQDHPRLLFAKEPGWTSLSDGTRRVQVLAEKIGAGQVSQDAEAQKTVANVTGIQQALGRGVTFPELISVQADDDNSIVLLEGHSRATAYVGLKWSKNIEMILGSSPRIRSWFFY